MESKSIHLRVSSSPENLARIRQLIGEITKKARLSKEDAGSIILAVDEACSNIIKHCCEDDETRNIELTVTLEKTSLTILIIDDGVPFDIERIKSRDITKIKPGGLGVHIIKQVMDMVEYSHTSKGFNKIKMVKKFNS